MAAVTDHVDAVRPEAAIAKPDGVWLGGEVIVFPGVTIGENTVVGAEASQLATRRPMYWPLAIHAG